jgi:hypothetical protein
MGEDLGKLIKAKKKKKAKSRNTSENYLRENKPEAEDKT